MIGRVKSTQVVSVVHRRRDVRLAFLAALLLPPCAYAEGPRLGVEYESERDARSARHNRAVTIKPGWEFAKGRLINVAELLIERNEDASTLSDDTRPRETKFFVRLRHSGNLDERWGYYIRGGVGRSVNHERKFTYAYMEPGLKYEFGSRWQWTVGWREVDAIDGTRGERVRKYIIGPSLNLNQNSEIELRYLRSTRDDDSWAWSIGYVRRF